MSTKAILLTAGFSVAGIAVSILTGFIPSWVGFVLAIVAIGLFIAYWRIDRRTQTVSILPERPIIGRENLAGRPYAWISGYERGRPDSQRLGFWLSNVGIAALDVTTDDIQLDSGFVAKFKRIDSLAGTPQLAELQIVDSRGAASAITFMEHPLETRLYRLCEQMRKGALSLRVALRYRSVDGRCFCEPHTLTYNPRLKPALRISKNQREN